MEQKKKNTWLWILGWIIIFPIPLTILLLRNKKLQPKVKYGILAAGWLVYIILFAAAGTGDTSDQTAKVPEITEDISETAEDSLEVSEDTATAKAEVLANNETNTMEQEEGRVESLDRSMPVADEESESQDFEDKEPEEQEPISEDAALSATPKPTETETQPTEVKEYIKAADAEPSPEQSEAPQAPENSDAPKPAEEVSSETGSGMYVVNGKNGKIHINGKCSATKEGSQNFMDIRVYFVTYEEAEAYSTQNFPKENKRNCGNCWK